VGRTRIDMAFDKLQDFLVAMVPGDEISAQQASDISGLDCERCGAILDSLARAGLMIRLQYDAYVRCRLQLPDAQAKASPLS
jgi:hypothetical protein